MTASGNMSTAQNQKSLLNHFLDQSKGEIQLTNFITIMELPITVAVTISAHKNLTCNKEFVTCLQVHL